MARATPHSRVNRDATRRGSRPRRNSAYASHYTDDELCRIIAALDDPGSDLSGAIEATHVILDRILARIDSETDPDRWTRLVQVWGDTTTRLASIMRTQRILSEQSADTLAGHIAAALDEVAAALGANL
jgi:DNA-binding transcriptional regulator YbjK